MTSDFPTSKKRDTRNRHVHGEGLGFPSLAITGVAEDAHPSSQTTVFVIRNSRGPSPPCSPCVVAFFFFVVGHAGECG